MNTSDDNPLYAAINAKLASVVDGSPSIPLWQQRWSRLGPDATDGERLAVYQVIRDSGSLPESAGHYLVSWQIDAMASEAAEDALRDLQERMYAILATNGLQEEELLDSGKVPPEYEAVRRQYMDAWDVLFAQKLEEFGEHAMAALFRSDRDRFEWKQVTGRQFFHGPASDRDSALPEWLNELVTTVGANMEADGLPGRLATRYGEEDGLWEVTVYCKGIELIGGAEDGAVVHPGFTLDVEGLRSNFERVDSVGWRAVGGHGPVGPHIFIDGVFQGHDVLLSVLAEAPDDEEPGTKFRL